MPDTNVKTIIFNKLTKEKYDSTTINPNEFYIITDYPEPLTQTEADTLYAAKSVESTVSTLTTTVANKANSADVYTQTAADAKFALKTDVSTISGKIPKAASADNKLVDNTSMTTALAGKANSADVYTKGDVDSKLSAKLDSSTATSTYATKSELDAKADADDVYTKSQVDTELAKKLDTTTASSTYATKTELSQQVASVYKVKGSVATESALPQEGNTTGDVYNVETDGMNYVWDGTQWDKLGGTVDLSNYYTKSQVDTELGKKLDTTMASSTYLTQTTASSTYATIQALNAKADASDVISIEDTIATYGTMATKNANDYSTKAVADTLYAPASLSDTVSTLSTTVSGKANASEVYTKTVADSTFATKTELSNKANNATTLEGYGITDAYTSEEVDNKLSGKLDTTTATSTYATITSVNSIEEVIPEDASTTNQLVDTNAMTTALAAKANTADLGTMASANASDYSTKAVADTLYAPIRKSVTDTDSTTITLANADANTVYHYGSLDSLTITAADVSDLETIIWFTPSANLTNIVIPDTIKPMNEFKPVSGKLSCVSILNGTIVYGSVL